ncbi:MAG: gamma-glutamyltransferase [Alphaproteobacteria bacterium]
MAVAACAPGPGAESRAPAVAEQPAPVDQAPAEGVPSVPPAVEQRDGKGAEPERPPARAARYMVSAANPLAAEAGREILRAGGSAIDAAIAAQMVLNLVEPQSSGVGGGAFLLHYAAATGEITAYDGRETAPEAATEDMFLASDGAPKEFFEAAVGGLAVGVPGLIGVLDLAHDDHGKLPWARLFAPAIELAEAGFAISPRLSRLIARDRHLKTFPEVARYFYDADGAPKAVGAIVVNAPLAQTFRAIAEGGAQAFYAGALARDIAAAVRGAADNPGRLSESDLEAYEAKIRAPLCAPYRVWLICGMGPPSSGGVTTLETLGILEHFDLAALEPNSVEAVHLISEASRLAFADRNAFLADSDFVSVPVARLLDPDYLAERAGLISRDRSIGVASPGLPWQAAARPAPEPSPGRASTSHISVIDSEGNAVAMTSSIEDSFGSRLMVGGFLLNNQLTDFSFRPEVDGVAVANRVAPGKRPRSSMAPTLVFDGAGRLVMTLGSPGGPRIIPYVVRTLIASLDWGLDVQRAISLANHANLNGVTELEQGTELEALAPALEAKGHGVRIRPLTSGLHGIMVREDGLLGGADPRREGAALGD